MKQLLRRAVAEISAANGLETLCLIALLVAALLSAYSIKTAHLAQHNTRVLNTELVRTKALELDNRRIERLLDRKADLQCQRTQTLRDRVNADTGTLFRISATLTHIVAEPSLLMVLSPSDRISRVRAVTALRHELRALRHEARTDCVAARNIHYQPPPSTRFPQPH